MLKIKARDVIRVGHQYDYELENGELLHRTEWNGEEYETESGIYRPVYEHNEKDDTYEIIGFED